MKFKCIKANRYGIKVGEVYHYDAFQTIPNKVKISKNFTTVLIPRDEFDELFTSDIPQDGLIYRAVCLASGEL